MLPTDTGRPSQQRRRRPWSHKRQQDAAQASGSSVGEASADTSAAASSAGPLQDVAAGPVRGLSGVLSVTPVSAAEKSLQNDGVSQEAMSAPSPQDSGLYEAGEGSQAFTELTTSANPRSQRAKNSRRNRKKAAGKDEAFQELVNASSSPTRPEASQSSPSAGRSSASAGSHGIAKAEPRATFYPKFENEHAEQEVRRRMLQAVATGSGVLEVSLKHSGSLFMYAGSNYGAYAKNSWGNLYTAVGVFVLSRTFENAWGLRASEKQKEFNHHLESRHLVVAMELVTAVLGDHGQRPRSDYVVVTGIADLSGKQPRFMATPDIVAFCHTWRLPNNSYWLLSTKDAAVSFFTAYDCLCEEGTATSVQNVLSEMAEVAVPATWDHRDVQGEILEGLVARVVSAESAQRMGQVTAQMAAAAAADSGERCMKKEKKSLRQVCAENRTSEAQQIKALLVEAGPSFCPRMDDWLVAGQKKKKNSSSKQGDNKEDYYLGSFLAATPADERTTKLQEMVRMLNKRPWRVRFKCQELDLSPEEQRATTLTARFRMIIHVLQDSVFRRYQNEMRAKPDLWPLYRGFFVDVSLDNKRKDRGSTEALATGAAAAVARGGGAKAEASAEVASAVNQLQQLTLDEPVADNDRHLMLKFKFLPYKIRTFLIRNGLVELFRKSKADYLAYVTRQLKSWGVSPAKAEEALKMCKAWAEYIQGKRGLRMLDSNTYLDEAEVFLAQYMHRGGESARALVGHAGGVNLIDVSPFIMQLGTRDPGNVEGEAEEEGGGPGMDRVEEERERGAARVLTLPKAEEGLPLKMMMMTKAQGDKGKGKGGPPATAAAAAAVTPGHAQQQQQQQQQQQKVGKGALIFFPGIPGCAKSAMSAELVPRLSASTSAGGLPVSSLMGDLIKGRYWKLLGDNRKRKPKAITIADKNAPNKDVWVQISDICAKSNARPIPVLVESQGTDSNPFCLSALAIFLARVLQRHNHPGSLDKSSPNAGYVLLMFYHLYAGQTRAEMEDDMLRRFGALVRQPLLRSNAGPLPARVEAVLEEGLSLYARHSAACGRTDSTKGPHAREWADWEMRMRETLSMHDSQLQAMQVPFAEAVESVVAQVEAILQGAYVAPEPSSTSTSTSTALGGGSIRYAAIALAPADVHAALQQLSTRYPAAAEFFATRKPKVERAHVTLAHKSEHGVAAVAAFGALSGMRVTVRLTALLFSESTAAAWEAQWGDEDRARGVVSRNTWPHVTVWTAEGVRAKEASSLPVLANTGLARQIRLEEEEAIMLQGHVELVR